MTTIVTILTEGFADWETTLLNAVAHAFYKVETRFATPGGKPVTSSGGMTVTPTLAARGYRRRRLRRHHRQRRHHLAIARTRPISPRC